MSFELPALPYEYDALEPHIDQETMHLHHDKHHQAYLNKLNAALEKHPELASKTAEELLIDLSALPSDVKTAIQNNGGGYVNHSIFWQSMSPNGGSEPIKTIGAAIIATFGSFSEFQEQFNAAGAGQFGSGWAWLVMDGNKNLQVMGTANQDSPLSQGLTPLLGNDVWEHAYYLQYKNRRPEYLKAWWNIVNWEVVEQRFTA